jgi:hypothetical protein
LYQHVVGPQLAAAETLRILKPGGRVVVVDVDQSIGGIVDPLANGLASISRHVQRVQAQQGGDREIGRKLPALLRQAGFEQLSVEGVVLHSEEIGVNPFLHQIAPERFLPFVIMGGLPREDWEAYRAEFNAFMRSPRGPIMQAFVAVTGVKPERRG